MAKSVAQILVRGADWLNNLSRSKKRERRAKRRRSFSIKRSSLLGDAAAIEKQQVPSYFAKKLRERVNLTLQNSDSDDSSASGQSESDDGEVLMPGTNTPEQARVEEASNHSSLDAARPRASSPKTNSFMSLAAFEELLQKSIEKQTNAILDAVHCLNENQARCGTGSYIGSQQVTNAHNSANQSNAGAIVISSEASSRVSSSVISSVSQQRVRDWLTSTENITQDSLLTKANIGTRNQRESAEVSKPAKKVQKHTKMETSTSGKKPCVSRITAVLQSISDELTVCSRSIGTQTEAEQSK